MKHITLQYLAGSKYKTPNSPHSSYDSDSLSSSSSNIVSSSSICLISSADLDDIDDPRCIKIVSILFGRQAVEVGDCKDSNFSVVCLREVVDSENGEALQVELSEFCSMVMVSKVCFSSGVTAVGTMSCSGAFLGSDLMVLINASVAFFFKSFAFCAASCVACRIANVIVVSAAPAGGFVSMDLDADAGGAAGRTAGLLFSWVFVGAFALIAGFAPGPDTGTILICCFNSPYSFQSSISTRS